MIRQVLGIAAASVAAHYLGAASLGLSIALKSPTVPSFEGFADFLFGTLFFGTFGMLLYGLPVLAVAIIAALVLYALDVTSPIVVASIGSFVGLWFGVILALPDFDHWPLALGCFISGAICGWIYWRIAMRRASSPSAVPG